MFSSFEEIQDFTKKQKEYSLISINTPLISNLNILENIAIVKEVHEHLQTSKAQEVALELLDKLDLADIGLYRAPQCKVMDIFYVMFIRALMTKENTIIIEIPHSIMDSLNELPNMFENLNRLNINKNILILDIIDNEIYYKGCSCNIIK